MPTHPETMSAPGPLPVAKLQDMLLDPNVSERDLRPYLMLDDTATDAFSPQVRVNPNHVQETMAESAFAFSAVNGISRWRRHMRYRARIQNWDGPRIVSEGDSWFQFPFMIEDVFDHLWSDHAILSLGAAGDLLQHILRQDELAGAVQAERPDVVLISAGGNDILGGARLKRYLEPFDPARPPTDYLDTAFDDFLGGALDDYRKLVRRVLDTSQDVRVVCHCYAYAIPAAGRWLGRPMASMGITDPALQRRIVVEIVNEFLAGLEALAQEPGIDGRLFIVDAREAVADGDWYDELHPDDNGFASVAKLFREKIALALNSGGMESLSARPDPMEHLAQVALQLASQHGEDTLRHELGRRVSLATEDPSRAPSDMAVVPSGSLEGLFDVFGDLGRRVIQRVEREAYDLLCGDDPDDQADRDKLRGAFGVGSLALSGYLVAALTTGPLALPVAAAPVAAAILLKRFGGGAWEEVCGAWSERVAALGAETDALEGMTGMGAPSLLIDHVSEGAKRSVNASGRMLKMLAGAESSLESSGAGVDLSNDRVTDSIEALRAALASSGDAALESAGGDSAAVDRVMEDAKRAFSKLHNEGERADISIAESFALEAVVRADGTRPVLFVQDDRVTTDNERLGDWAGALSHFADRIGTVAQSVCRINVPFAPQGFAGTGFVIADGLVATNRHVLEDIAKEDRVSGVWTFRDTTTVDFAAELDRDRAVSFRVESVAYAGPDPILRRLDFKNLDVAILRCVVEDQPFPAPLSFEKSVSAYDKGRNIYVMGFPGRPRNFFGVGVPTTGTEHLPVLNDLFLDKFGVKRFAPGKLLDQPGTLPGDVKGWIINHDASTVGGNSGSTIVDFSSQGERVMGVHFGGKNRAENWAHAVALIQDQLALHGAEFIG